MRRGDSLFFSDASELNKPTLPYFLFPREAKLPVYEKLWDFIERHGTLEKNHTAGIEKVRNTENYAFIWDSAVLEYDVQQEPCNTLTLIER